MPIRWTAELDQVLLLKILETQNIKVDYNAIAASWPAGHEKPTAKALSEHLSKLKRNASNFASASGSPVTSIKATPRAPRARGSTKKATPSSLKRKANAKNVDSDEGDDESEDDYGTPAPAAKKQARTPRTAAKAANKVLARVAAIEDSDNSAMSESADSGSEFNPPTPNDPNCEPAEEKIAIKEEVVVEDARASAEDVKMTGGYEMYDNHEHHGGAGSFGPTEIAASFGDVNAGFTFDGALVQ